MAVTQRRQEREVSGRQRSGCGGGGAASMIHRRAAATTRVAAAVGDASSSSSSRGAVHTSVPAASTGLGRGLFAPRSGPAVW